MSAQSWHNRCMDVSVLPLILKLTCYGAAFAATLHLAMIGYHWYSYTTERAYAHVVVGTYAAVIIVSLATMFAIAFISYAA